MEVNWMETLSSSFLVIVELRFSGGPSKDLVIVPATSWFACEPDV